MWEKCQSHFVNEEPKARRGSFVLGVILSTGIYWVFAMCQDLSNLFMCIFFPLIFRIDVASSLFPKRRKLSLENAETFTVVGDCKTLAKVSWSKLRNKRQESKTWRSKHHGENQRPNGHMEVSSQHLTCPRPQFISRGGGIWTLIWVAPKPKLLSITLPVLILFFFFFRKIMAK